MTCKQCGASLLPGDKFCRICGASVEDAAPPAGVPEPPPHAEVRPDEAAPVKEDCHTAVLTLEPEPAAPQPQEAPAEPGPRFSTPDPISRPPAAPLPPLERPAPPIAPPTTPPGDGPAPDTGEDGDEDMDEEAAGPEWVDGLPQRSSRERVLNALASLGLALLFFLSLALTGLSLSLHLGGCEARLYNFAAELSVPALSLKLLTACCSLAAAVGLGLLTLALALTLIRGNRAAIACRYLGVSAAASGLSLLLLGLLYASSLLFPPEQRPILAVLEGDGGLRSRLFLVGFILLVLGLAVLIPTFFAKRAPSVPRRAGARAALTALAVLLLLGSSAALSSGVTAALQRLAPAAQEQTPEPEPDAQSSYDSGDLQGAATLLEAKVADGSANAADFILLSRCRTGLAGPEAAMEALRAGLAAYPGDTSLRAELADVLTALGNQAAAAASGDRASADAAIGYYKEAMEYAPGDTTLSLAIMALTNLWNVDDGAEAVYYRWIASGDLSWSAAIKEVQQPGRTLPILADKAAFQAVTDMADAMGLTLVWLPAKLDDPAVKTSARWLDGSAMSYLPWYPRALPGQSGSEDRLALLKVDDGWYLAALPDEADGFAEPDAIGWVCQK